MNKLQLIKLIKVIPDNLWSIQTEKCIKYLSEESDLSIQLSECEDKIKLGASMTGLGSYITLCPEDPNVEYLRRRINSIVTFNPLYQRIDTEIKKF